MEFCGRAGAVADRQGCASYHGMEQWLNGKGVIVPAMSIKKKIASLLSGQKPAEAVEGTVPEAQEPAGEEIPEVVGGSTNQYVLELPAEHPLYHLYNQRRHEAGYLPAPRLCLDEEGSLSAETVHAELPRLRTQVTSACNARMKEIRGKKGGQGKKKKKAKDAKAGEGEQTAPDQQAEGPPVLDALPCFFISADKLLAWILVFPPTKGGAELSRNQIYDALVARGIGYGIDTHLVDQLAHDEKKYFNLYLVARGKPAFDGKNGNIVDNFPRIAEHTLEVDEFDQVDYTALNLIQNVDQGQEICRLIKPTEGEPGRSVLDEEIPAKSGKDVPLPMGRNTELSEDGTQLLAAIAGSVEFNGHSFQVNPVLEIAGDVDFSTGSLNFMGDINIRGNILSGFNVRAMGNVHVAGVVEAGSAVEAGGDLVVVKGILGDGTTTVRVQRSVFSKYVENAILSVRENLQTDCIISSSIYCGGEVVVQSGRGSIMGGQVWAAERIRANAVGSRSECRTSIHLGGKPCDSFEQEMARREVNALEMELERLSCQPENPARSSLMSKAKIKLMTAEMKLRQLEARGDGPKDGGEEAKDGENGRLECAIAYPGTKVRIGSEALRLHSAQRRCVITMVQGEIVVM